MKEKFTDWLSRLGRKPAPEPEIEFKGYAVPEPEKEPIENEPAVKEPAANTEPEKENKSMSSELKILHPESAAEVRVAADHLMDGCTVFLNLELLDKPTVTRMLDFLQGVTYAVRGKIKKSSDTTYIITPGDVDITDDQD